MKQQVINLSCGPGVTRPTLLWMPPNPTGPLSLLVFLHGAGEAGTNLANIYGSATAGGPAYWIEQGVLAPTDTIIISPQSPSSGGNTPAELDFMISDMIVKYPVNTARIYLTGLSNGGACAYEYICKETVVPKWNIAAAVIMSMATGYPTDTELNTIKLGNVNVWGFGSDPADIYGIMTHMLIVGNNNGNVGPKLTIPGLQSFGLGVWTNYPGGHCCWGQFYDPRYVDSGTKKDIYTWLKQFSSGGSVVVTAPPPSTLTLTGITATRTWSDGSTDSVKIF